MNPQRRGSGRKNGSERIRELVSILASLSKQGARVSIDTLSERLGISRDEAQGMMHIVIQASGEESSGLLISANDDMTEFTLEYPAVRGRAIRLNDNETIALVHALDQVGIADSDPLRQRLRNAFSSPDVQDDAVRQILGSPQPESVHNVLSVCAKALADRRMLRFSYKGVSDSEPTERWALVRSLRIDGNSWYIDTYDLDKLADRTFRVDRMIDASLGPHGRLPVSNNEASTSARVVSIRFADPHLLTIFEWPGLRITKQTSECIEGRIMYFGERSDWIIRRIIACGGRMTIGDERIMQLAREYARSLIH